MDNLTHTLIGALVGETAAIATRADPNGLTPDLRRTLLVGSAAVGSNLPDSDLLYSFFAPNVNYLLHHRGHTHTVIGALVLAAVLYALVRWWLQRQRFTISRQDRVWIAGMLMFTALLHIGMDFMNNYGVHPFWPIDTRWYYGDSVFIIEPLLWAACAPLALVFKAIWARALVVLLLLIGMGLVFFTGMVPATLAVLFTALIGVMLLIARVCPPKVALAISVAFWLGVTATFAIASSIAEKHVRQQVAQDFPETRLLDHILSPMPANPLCWEVILVQADRREVTLRRAMLSLAPKRLPAGRCGKRLTTQTTAPLVAVRSADLPGWQWHGEVRTPLALLTKFEAQDCRADAALRFIRAPYVAQARDGWILGDLRYDREPGIGFAEIEIGRDPGPCPAFVPSWTPPRADLLTTSAQTEEPFTASRAF
jgi:inner membrane protein